MIKVVLLSTSSQRVTIIEDSKEESDQILYADAAQIQLCSAESTAEIAPFRLSYQALGAKQRWELKSTLNARLDPENLETLKEGTLVDQQTLHAVILELLQRVEVPKTVLVLSPATATALSDKDLVTSDEGGNVIIY